MAAKVVSSENIVVGDRIDVGGVDTDRRGIIVTDINPAGMAVIWYRPDGVGPFTAVLPHASLQRCAYHDERAGQGESWWDTHPDITGKTGEV